MKKTALLLSLAALLNVSAASASAAGSGNKKKGGNQTSKNAGAQSGAAAAGQGNPFANQGNAHGAPVNLGMDQVNTLSMVALMNMIQGGHSAHISLQPDGSYTLATGPTNAPIVRTNPAAPQQPVPIVQTAVDANAPILPMTQYALNVATPQGYKRRLCPDTSHKHFVKVVVSAAAANPGPAQS